MAETKITIPVEMKMGNAGTNDANLPAFKEGSIIFTKDTKKIYIDPVGETERIEIGGGDNSNISNDTATASLKQLQDSSYMGIKIKTKNSNAYNLDNTLTDNETIGSLGNFSSSFGGNTQAKGKRSFATGTGTIAKGGYSFASGSDSVALGSASHVEGYRNTTGPSADSAHAEGGENIVTSNRGHAEGYMNTVSGENSHAEGGKNTVSGENSHAEGLSNTASGKYSHAEGQETYAMGNQSHTEGAKTKALGSASHAEGDTNETYSYAAHIEGSGNKILTTINSSDTPGTGSGGSPFDPNFKIDEHRGDNSHVEGAQNLMYGYTAHAEGTKNIVKGHYAHAEGINNTITIDAEASHVEGNSNNVTSKYSHTEGYNNTNNGLHAHVEGYNNTTKSQSTHIEGENNTIENSTWAHVEGCNNSISNGASAAHVEGSNNDARGVSAHAEGASTKAWGAQSHSGGYDTVASGDYSFVHGISSSAMGESSVAFGRNNSAYPDQFVIGKYAKTYDDPNDIEIPYEYFAVGNGDSSTRKNAFTVYRDGHAEVQTMGTTNNSVVIKTYVDTETAKKQGKFADLDYVWEGDSFKYLSLNLKNATKKISSTGGSRPITGGAVSPVSDLTLSSELGDRVYLTVGAITVDPIDNGRYSSGLSNTFLKFKDREASATLPSMLITPTAHSGTTPAYLTFASPAQNTAVGNANVRLTGIAAPTADNDAANKAYVDTQVATKQAKFAEYTSTRPSEEAPVSASTNILVLNEGKEFCLRDRATNPLVEFKLYNDGVLQGTTNNLSLTTKNTFALKSNIFTLSNDNDDIFQVVMDDSKKVVYYGLKGGDDNGSLYLTNTSRTAQQGATLQGNVSSDARTTALVVNESNTKLLSWKQGTTTNNAPLLGVSTPVATADTSKGITAADLPYQAVNKKYVDDAIASNTIKQEMLKEITQIYFDNQHNYIFDLACDCYIGGSFSFIGSTGCNITKIGNANPTTVGDVSRMTITVATNNDNGTRGQIEWGGIRWNIVCTSGSSWHLTLPDGFFYNGIKTEAGNPGEIL